jgi:hypothetical protein
VGSERLEEANLGWYGLDGDRHLTFRWIDDRSGVPWLKASKLPSERTNLVHCMFWGLGEMPLFLLQQASPQDLLYGYVGSDDCTLDPLLRRGAFVQIDPQQIWSPKPFGPANMNVRSTS